MFGILGSFDTVRVMLTRILVHHHLFYKLRSLKYLEVFGE